MYRATAFSLLEVLVTIVVIGILALLLLPVLSSMRGRAQRAQCMANLKTLYVGTEAYIQQNGSWPQIDVEDSDDFVTQYAQDWIAALKPFGVSAQNWICPTVQNSLGNPDYMQPGNERIDYGSTTFDDKPITPHQWPKQPWFAEAGDVHGNGPLIIFTDGSISDLKSVLSKPSASSQ